MDCWGPLLLFFLPFGSITIHQVDSGRETCQHVSWRVRWEGRPKPSVTTSVLNVLCLSRLVHPRAPPLPWLVERYVGSGRSLCFLSSGFRTTLPTSVSISSLQLSSTHICLDFFWEPQTWSSSQTQFGITYWFGSNHADPGDSFFLYLWIWLAISPYSDCSARMLEHKNVQQVWRGREGPLAASCAPRDPGLSWPHAQVHSDAGFKRASFSQFPLLPSTWAKCFFHRFCKRSRVYRVCESFW